MQVFALTEDEWTMLAEITSSGDRRECPVLDMLFGCEHRHQAHADAMFAMLDEISETAGPLTVFSTNWIRSVNDDPKIYEFRQGRFRILWAYGKQGRTIYLLEGFMKDSRKTPRSNIDAAKRQLKKMNISHESSSMIKESDYEYSE